MSEVPEDPVDRTTNEINVACTPPQLMNYCHCTHQITFGAKNINKFAYQSKLLCENVSLGSVNVCHFDFFLHNWNLKEVCI